MQALVSFIVHAILIWLGVKVAGVKNASFWHCLIIALLSFIIVAVLRVFLFPLFLVPLLSSLISAALLLFATAFASKLIVDMEWGPAWTISIVVAITHAILNWILPWSVR